MKENCDEVDNIIYESYAKFEMSTKMSFCAGRQTKENNIVFDV